MRLDHRGLARIAVSAAALAAAASVFVLMAMRLRYGVDFKDEAYYLAVTYRFVLGDRPFIDEQSFLQLPSLLTFPFVKAFVALTGGTTGIVLFMRVLWLAFATSVAAAGFAFLRRVTRWQVALVACLLPLVAVPFNVPTLSYNSMGSGLLALGMALGAQTTIAGRSRRWLLAAGFAHGLAAWAYPTLSLAVVVFAVALVALYRRDALRPVAAYVGAAAVVGVALASLLVAFGLGNVAESWKYMSSLAGYAGGESKLWGILARGGQFFAQQPVFLVSLVVATVLHRVLPKPYRRFALVLPVVAVFPVTFSLGYAIVGFGVTLVGLAGLWLGPFIRGRETAERLYVWGMLPALACACITAYTSSNGFMNAGIGFYPALFVTPGLLALALTPEDGEATGEEPTRATRTAAALVPWVLMAVFLLTALRFGQYQYRTVYHDSQRKFLTERVVAGPFAGLWTRPDNHAFEEDLRADVARFAKPGMRVLFFDDLPGGYLYTKARPGANSLWLSWSDDLVGPERHSTLAYWRRTGNYPDVAFRYLWREKYRKGHTLKAFIAPPRFRREALRGRFEVWARAEKL